jgi:ubiquitin-conjugating enzyme E2 J2
MCKEPVPHILARPSHSDIREWHYVLEGSEGTPFEGGVYHGKIKFPEEYPFKPPGIRFLSYLFFPYSYCFQTTPHELTLVRQE